MVPMEEALNPTECQIMRLFFADLIKASQEARPPYNVMNYMIEWREARHLEVEAIKGNKFCGNCVYLQRTDDKGKLLPVPKCMGDRRPKDETTPGCYVWAAKPQ